MAALARLGCSAARLALPTRSGYGRTTRNGCRSISRKAKAICSRPATILRSIRRAAAGMESRRTARPNSSSTITAPGIFRRTDSDIGHTAIELQWPADVAPTRSIRVSAYFEHVSNGWLGTSVNEGMDNLGLRIGY